MVNFSSGWNFVTPTGLKYRCDYSAQFQPSRKTQISMRKFTEVQKHYSAPFSARTEKNDSEYMDFSARLAGLEIQARFENTGLGFFHSM